MESYNEHSFTGIQTQVSGDTAKCLITELVQDIGQGDKPPIVTTGTNTIW
jgi:hypothetical protein